MEIGKIMNDATSGSAPVCAEVVHLGWGKRDCRAYGCRIGLHIVNQFFFPIAYPIARRRMVVASEEVDSLIDGLIPTIVGGLKGGWLEIAKGRGREAGIRVFFAIGSTGGAVG